MSQNGQLQRGVEGSSNGLSFKKLMKEGDRMGEENRELKNLVRQLQVEAAEKDIKIREIQLEKYKITQPYQDQIRTLKSDHQREIMQAKTAFQNENKSLIEKLEAVSKNKTQKLVKENQDLKQQLQSQRISMKKASELQISILRTKLESEQQQMRVELQNEKNNALASMQNKQKQITSASRQQTEALKRNYEKDMAELKAKSQKQIQNLKITLASERQLAKSQQDQLRVTLDERLNLEAKNIKEKYQKQKGQLRGSFIDERTELEGRLETRNEELKRRVAQLEQQKSKLAEAHQAEVGKLKKVIESHEKKMAADHEQIQSLQEQNFKLNSHISSYDKSLGFYQQQIDYFDSFIEKNNNHLVEQLKCLDDLYSQPSLEKMKLTQLLIKQYKQLVRLINHSIMIKIINEKEAIISNYVGQEMMRFLKVVDEIDVTDFYSVHSEKGSRFKRVIENVNLFKSLESQNINDAVEMYFSQKVLQKAKALLANHGAAISSNNNEGGELQFIKFAHQYYELRDFLSVQFPEHEAYCSDEYKTINASIAAGFDRFSQAYAQIRQNRPVQSLEDNVKRAEELKKFVIVLHTMRNHRKYCYQLERHLGITVEDAKSAMLNTLNDHKKYLKQNCEELMQRRVYYDCFVHQRIYKKLRIFDEILTKEENSYYNFNFSELYNKIVNLLRIIRDEKLSLAGIIITEERISTVDLDREYAGIAFDSSVKGLFIQRLMSVLHGRMLFLNRVNQNLLISNRTAEQFENYYLEALQLRNIREISDILEVSEHANHYDAKVPHFITYLKLKFKQYYHNINEFKQVAESGRNIKSSYQFEMFLQQHFKDHHRSLKEAILETRYSKLPDAESENECVFHMLLRLSTQKQSKLDRIVNNPDEAFVDEHFECYTNMTAGLSKYEGGKLQEKLNRSVEESIAQLEAKEWLEGDLNSPLQRKLMIRLNKLANKQIAFYRELIIIHKNKTIEERQRIVNSEKRTLKEDEFGKLQQFVAECEKHEAGNSKFYKLYINILDEYVNYTYDNLEGDNDKKCKFVQNIYKLNLVNSTKNVKEVFKTKEHGLYFCRPDLFSIKDNVSLIEGFQGETEVNISQAVKQLADVFKLYSILKGNLAKSLLDDGSIQKIQVQIGSIKYDVTKSYIGLCRSVEDENLFDQKCDKRRLFLTFIKIEIFLRLMKKLQEIAPEQEYYETIEEYNKIIERNNNRIEKIYEEIKKFRFNKEELAPDYEDNDKVLEHLRRIERYIEVFKDIKYNLHKLEDYLKNNYLERLRLKDIDHREVILIIEMTWIKEYALVKKEIAEMFSKNHWEVSFKYKLLLTEKELVKNENLLYYNEFIKEEYDFKKTVQEELMLIDAKCERYIHELEKEHEFYHEQIRKLEQNRKNYIQTEKQKIRSKYTKLIADVRNSFHEIESQKIRQKKIEAEINTLKNQMRTEEEKLLDYETKNIQTCRAKWNQKLKRWIGKIFYIVSIIRNVQKSFDRQIEELCQHIEAKINEEISKQDKSIKYEFDRHDKRYSNNQSALGAINISQLRSTHNIAAKSEQDNNQLRVASEVNEDQNSINTEAIELKSKSHLSKATEKNMERSMINIDHPQESEQENSQYKIKVAPQPDKPKKKSQKLMRGDKEGLKGIIEKCPQLRNNEALANRISQCYSEYQKQLERVQGQYREYKSESRLLKMINETKQSAKTLKPSILMARIFAVYSIYESIDANQQSQINFDGNPYPSQVLAALLLTNAQSQDHAQLANSLIELKPGEGKSRVLAAVNCYLALKGYQVFCSTFSTDLAQRDQQQYKKLYQGFGVEQKVTYGPAYEHCLAILDDSDHNLIEVTKKILLGQKISSEEEDYVGRLSKLSKKSGKTNKILVIDEIDILFDRQFGDVYTPLIDVDTAEVKKVIKFIWANRSNEKLSKIIKNSQQYTALMRKHPKISEILDNQIDLMISASNNYKNCAYKVEDKDIVLQSKEKQVPYGSVFSSCFQFQNGRIIEKNYNKYLKISLKLGQILYSQLPKLFDHILAVTGSADSLSNYYQSILRQQYKINEIYNVPSKFNEQNRKIIGFRSFQKNQYIKNIVHRLQEMKKVSRPTLVVFQKEEDLNILESAGELSQYSADIYKISESSSSSMKSSLINYAGSRGRITLTTYQVARGADFMVYDSEINQKGGMHVIQAYAPSKQQQFVYILGRTARQGKLGSYQMVVSVAMLAKKSIKQVDDGKLFDALKDYWKNNSQKQNSVAQETRKKAKSEHEKVFQALGDGKRLYDCIMKWNYVQTKSDVIKTIIAIDGTGSATGSMGLAINAILNIIKETIDKTDQIIKQKNRKSSYEHKIMIFRNYSSKYQKIIEKSNFSNSANQLQGFLASIKAEGGLGNEAHEVLFYEIGKLCETERVDQIILIGDAAANKYDEIVKYRKKFSGEAYWATKVPLLPKAETYLEPIAKRQIPIHSMYILKNKPQSVEGDKNVKLYFQNLSRQQNGVCKELNIIEKEKTMNELTAFITQRVLMQIGADLVQVFREKYNEKAQ